MPTVVQAARVTTKDDAVWRECGQCGRLVAAADGVDRCASCTAPPSAEVTATDDSSDGSSTVLYGLVLTAAELDEARAELAEVCRRCRTPLERMDTVNAYLCGYLGGHVTRLAAGATPDSSTRHAAALFAARREVTR